MTSKQLLGAIAALLTIVVIALAVADGRDRDLSAKRAPVRASDANKARDPQCPRPLAPGTSAPEDAATSVRAQLPKLFAGSGSEGARLFAVEALGPRPGVVGLDPTRYARVAARKCGTRVARRTWAVFIEYPNAPMANSGAVAVLTARTRTGWHPWFVLSPAAGRGQFTGLH